MAIQANKTLAAIGSGLFLAYGIFAAIALGIAGLLTEIPFIGAVVIPLCAIIGYYDFLGLPIVLEWVFGILCVASAFGIRDRKFGYLFVMACFVYIACLCALFCGWYIGEHGLVIPKHA